MHILKYNLFTTTENLSGYCKGKEKHCQGENLVISCLERKTYAMKDNRRGLPTIYSEI